MKDTVVPQLFSIVSVDRTDFVVAAGPAGFVDTDMTSIIPPSAKAVFVNPWPSAGGGVSMRPPGSTAAVSASWSPTMCVSAAVGGHVELQRQAGGDNHYEVFAYIP